MDRLAGDREAVGDQADPLAPELVPALMHRHVGVDGWRMAWPLAALVGGRGPQWLAFGWCVVASVEAWAAAARERAATAINEAGRGAGSPEAERASCGALERQEERAGMERNVLAMRDAGA